MKLVPVIRWIYPNTDLPDKYFVGTPYISGELVWVGTRKNGHFVLKSSPGSSKKGLETVIVKRAVGGDGFSNFEIVLSDGTRLIFDKSDKMSEETVTWAQMETQDWSTCYGIRIQKKESVPVSWKLTKVLFPDYMDGSDNPDDNPLNSQDNNKGSWICYTYNTIADKKLLRPWMLRQSGNHQTAYIGVGYGEPIEVNYLNEVITPNEYAEYNYTLDRKDYLWKQWAPSSSPPYKLLVGDFFFPVLRNIEIFTPTGIPRKKISFTTDYYLRANTYSAANFLTTFWDDFFPQTILDDPEPVNFDPFNPQGGALTLRNIKIEDKGVTEKFEINFQYNSYNPPAFLTNNEGVFNWNDFRFDSNCNDRDNEPPFFVAANWDDDRLSKFWFIEQRDLWGYFCPSNNNCTSNNLNVLGTRTRSENANNFPYAAAWSLKKISFSNGNALEWEYEANRYNYCNGVEVFSSTTPQLPRFAGGIRVKKVNAYNGFATGANNPISVSYFYSSGDNDFSDGTTNSSGYATFDPYNTLASSDYRDGANSTKGGFYSNGLIAYEKVKIVPNFQTVAPNCPNGYTIYNFTHAGDPSVDGFHPNGGTYGDVDSSWMRGLLLSATQYDSEGKAVSSTNNDYIFEVQEIPAIVNSTKINVKSPENTNYPALKNTVGWARVAEKTVTAQGVETGTEYKFAPETGSILKDKLEDDIYVLQQSEPWENTFEQLGLQSSQIGAFTKTKGFGSVNKNDYVVAIPYAMPLQSSCIIDLRLGIDVPWELGNDDTWEEYWYKNTYLSLDFFQAYNVAGVSVANVSGDASKPDIVLFAGFLGSKDIDCFVLEDVYIDGSNNINWVPGIQGEPNFGATYRISITMPTPNPTNSNITVSAAIGDVNNNSIPDAILLDGDMSNHGAAIPRRIYGVLDLSKTMKNVVQYACVSRLYGTQEISGSKICMYSRDPDGIVNDMEITGCTSAGLDVYPVLSTMLDNLTMDNSAKTLSAGNPFTKGLDGAYFSLGPKDPSLTSRDYYYLGMSKDLTDADEKNQQLFAIFRPQYHQDDVSDNW